ncbi:MAG: TrkA family potassium uptake protein [Spirochaetaceae bacterium]|jgi:trk system potassium uptake protein TrkA|nr:TrkA family potassium uptake protein [Spirochaetaceae bacterium]
MAYNNFTGLKQIAILGLGHFGKSILDELLELNVDVLIVDKDRDVIDTYKDSPVNAVALDILTVETLRKILPDSIDVVIIDLGGKIEASVLATSYCAKLNIKSIIVKAETDTHGEILELVGATKIVFPNREAAKRVTPLLFSTSMLSYLPVSGGLAIAELSIPELFFGKTLIETELRKKYQLNLLSVRTEDTEYTICEPNYVFKAGDIGLFYGIGEALQEFSGSPLRGRHPHGNFIARMLKSLRGR